MLPKCTATDLSLELFGKEVAKSLREGSCNQLFDELATPPKSERQMASVATFWWDLGEHLRGSDEDISFCRMLDGRAALGTRAR